MEKHSAHRGHEKSSHSRKHRSAHGSRVARGGDGKSRQVDPELRRAMVAEAAYFRAEKRGFTPGEELVDWLLAEAEIESLLDSMIPR